MNTANRKTPPAFLPAALAAWLAYLALDFLTHAVILATWWQTTAAYWLPPAELFQRIPYAYLSFAIYSASLVWLLTRILGPRPGLIQSLRLGATVGFIFGVATALGNYSVFDMPLSALLVWPASAMFASLGASLAAAAVLAAQRPWRRLVTIFFIALLVFAAGVLLQNV